VNTDRVFRGSIPALYDEHLGPLIFAPYADDLASRLAGLGHDRICRATIKVRPVQIVAQHASLRRRQGQAWLRAPW
jgi:hypothetical protein